MGCDGGTIPRRDELVRTKKKPEQKDKNAETVAKWKHCAITQNALHKPIVACELGKLYNKEAVLEHLLNKDIASNSAAHIMKLSDVKELNLTEKPGFAAKANSKGDEYVDFHDSRYICPVTGVEMNGKQRFYIMWKCGCVLSERAIKEINSETCHKCGTPYNEKDVIILNGSDDEMDILRVKMVERRRLAKLNKKKKKAAAASGGPDEKKIKLENGESIAKTSSSDIKIKTEPKEDSPSTSGTISQSKAESSKPPSAYAASTSAASKLVNGIKKEVKQQNSKMSAKGVLLPEKAKTTYSIAKDPSASAAYKSLFTSHNSAKTQDKAHWVTHNPLYY